MKLVVLTGAGMSQESGLSTFRDSGGLWDKYDIYEVATPQAWQNNRELVLQFYNERRAQLFEVEPNLGHVQLAELENNFDVEIVTQNVDNLHERAGSTKVLHLHGELSKSRSTRNPKLVYNISGPHLNLGDKCELGSQLRPHIVWFGEQVPMMDLAEKITRQADILLVIGTSLNVYPAAGLIHLTKNKTPIYVIDPADMNQLPENVVHLKKTASEGLKQLTPILLESKG